MLDTEEKPVLRIEALPSREQAGFLSLLRQWPLATRNPRRLQEFKPRRRSRWRVAGVVLFGLLPTILTGIYLFAFAADRYVSAASFVVRTASKPMGSGGFGALLQ